MKFLAGLIGAVIGIVVCFMAANLMADATNGGDTFSSAFGLAILSPLILAIGLMLGIVGGLYIEYVLRTNISMTLTQRRGVIEALVFGITAIVGVMGWVDGRLTGPPSDAQLLAQFHQNQPTLERLVGMVQQDKGLQRVSFDGTNPDDPRKIGISPARIAEYRHLLDSVGIHQGFDASGPGTVVFNNWGQGSVLSSDTDKGIAYLTQPPAHIMGNLDRCGPSANSVEAYRHITGNWYLYYAYIPD